MIQSIHHAMLSEALVREPESETYMPMVGGDCGRERLMMTKNKIIHIEFDLTMEYSSDGRACHLYQATRNSRISLNKDEREKKNLNLIPKVVKIGTDFFILLNKIG